MVVLYYIYIYEQAIRLKKYATNCVDTVQVKITTLRP